MLPLDTAIGFDQPWLRGTISAFGVLHLLLVLWELVHPTLLTPVLERPSQDNQRT
jgi:hypothetical protein